MKKEYVIERQGKQMVLYKGLLDLAHEKGLHSLETELVQIPDEKNGKVAIVRATVTMRTKEKPSEAETDAFGDGSVYRIFSEYGDAAPNNVAPAMQTALIRMAATRAKARALRDAVNIGDVSVEELGDESEVQERRGAAKTPSDDAPVSGAGENLPKQKRPAWAATPEGERFCKACAPFGLEPALWSPAQVASWLKTLFLPEQIEGEDGKVSKEAMSKALTVASNRLEAFSARAKAMNFAPNTGWIEYKAQKSFDLEGIKFYEIPGYVWERFVDLDEAAWKE